MDNKYTVYRHIAPNGKMYVGITSNVPKYRWNYGKGYKTNKYFTRAINKYGWENFKHEILLSNLTKEQACCAERIFIGYWDLTNSKHGYNKGLGGDSVGKMTLETRKKMSKSRIGSRNPMYGRGGIKSPVYGTTHSKEVRLKISKSLTGRKLSKEHCENISKGRKGKNCGINNPMYGKHLSDDAKAKLSKANNNKKKAVIAIDKNTLQIVGHFDSMMDAERKLGVKSGNISNCWSGKYKSAGGYIWRYA